MSTTHTQDAPVYACNLTVIAPDELEGSIALAKRLLFNESQESHELPGGYVWRFTAHQYAELCQFIDYDRRCCPMYTHTLEVTPANGPIWLRVTTDNDELKAALLAEIATLQSEATQHSQGEESMNRQMNHNVPIACDVTAIDADVRPTHLTAAEQLLRHDAAEVQELSDGYAFRFGAEQYAQVTAFIANERLCCPFFTFTLEVTPTQGPLWLRMSGSEEIKGFLKSALGVRTC